MCWSASARSGSPGRRIYFDGLGFASNLYAVLTDPYGNQVFDYVASDAGPYTLAWPGTYSLTVFSYSTTRATGNYAFSLDDISTATNIGAIAASSTRSSLRRPSLDSRPRCVSSAQP